MANAVLAAGGMSTEYRGDRSGLFLPAADDQSITADEDQPIDITLTGAGEWRKFDLHDR